jgi:DNA invertase Pin-like site-specific DNA recombinase
VSTRDQQLVLQLDALRQAGCTQIYEEVVSGARTERPVLQDLLTHLREGDVLLIWKLDRLGLSPQAEATAMAAETLYREGQLSVRQIAAKLHIAKSTLYVYLHARGVTIGPYQSHAGPATPTRQRKRAL